MTEAGLAGPDIPQCGMGERDSMLCRRWFQGVLLLKEQSFEKREGLPKWSSG